ncbi:unnamed protein product [Pseudo-nitzschia multistriata]|uniref:Uncharacterized protein n=1 Tax=Pseudo-nitzschia multistriata TaxID=183589 RepID=A0A448ZAW4_9STRA|nr:unnamed protein product [Pseudo-nitzschia multistriata]
MFLKRSSKSEQKKRVRDRDCVGTAAIADSQQEVNARTFLYPSSGFVTRIEHSLLYAMIREPDIFPESAVLKAIEEENYSMYFYVRPERGKSVTEYDVSYAQLTATLALAAEEWDHNSEVPPVLCQKVSQCVLRYATNQGLDRKTELDDLLQPLYQYAVRREAKQSKKMMRWIVPALGASLLVGNPLPAYAALVSANLAQTKEIEKGQTSNTNTDRMMSTGERAANTEHASLLEEEYDDVSI